MKSGKLGSPIHRSGKGFRCDVREECHTTLGLVIEDGCGVAVLVETALNHIAEPVDGCSYACDVVEAGLVPFVVVSAKVGSIAYGFEEFDGLTHRADYAGEEVVDESGVCIGVGVMEVGCCGSEIHKHTANVTPDAVWIGVASV